jgi:hypothetical protein
VLKGVTLLIRRGSSTIEQKPKEIENLLNSYKYEDIDEWKMQIFII